MSTERLLQIKEQITEAKAKKSEIKGQITSVEAQAKEKFKVSMPAEGEKKLGEMGEMLDQKEEKFKEKFEELESAYSWE